MQVRMGNISTALRQDRPTVKQQQNTSVLKETIQIDLLQFFRPINHVSEHGGRMEVFACMPDKMVRSISSAARFSVQIPPKSTMLFILSVLINVVPFV